MQGQGNQIQINFLIEEYQDVVKELQNELVMTRAYIKQLEAQLTEAIKKNKDKNDTLEQVVIPNEENESK